jgi:hypothetical protein
VPSGAGQQLGYVVTIKNELGSSHTYDLSVTSSTGTGVAYSLSTSSITLGAGATGTFTMTADHYEEVPSNVAELIIKEAAKDKKDEEDEE